MSFDQDPNEQANISGADLAILMDELTAANTQLAHQQTYIKHLEKQWGMLQAKLTAERAVSDKLEKALEEINKNDPFKQSSAGIIARAALVEVAAIRSKGEKQ